MLIACSCLSSIATAQAVHALDFSQVVVPIASAGIIPSVKIGITGRPDVITTLRISAQMNYNPDTKSASTVSPLPELSSTPANSPNFAQLSGLGPHLGCLPLIFRATPGPFTSKVQVAGSLLIGKPETS